jgi:hypothetical protein
MKPNIIGEKVRQNEPSLKVTYWSGRVPSDRDIAVELDPQLSSEASTEISRMSSCSGLKRENLCLMKILQDHVGSKGRFRLLIKY